MRALSALACRSSRAASPPILACGSGPGTIGFPINVGGRSVASGDLLVGDRDGVVMVPRADMSAVADKLEQVRSAEQAAEAAVKGGRTGLDEIAALLASDRVQYVD